MLLVFQIIHPLYTILSVPSYLTACEQEAQSVFKKSRNPRIYRSLSLSLYRIDRIVGHRYEHIHTGWGVHSVVIFC